MKISTFDNLEIDPMYNTDERLPLVEEMSDDDKVKWCAEMFDIHWKASEIRIEEFQKFVELYKGTYAYPHENLNKSVVNFVYEMIDMKIASRGRMKVACTVIPNNDEPGDIANAKACKMLLDARADEINLDGLHSSADLAMFQFGTTIMWVTWDPLLGTKSPLMERLENRYPDGVPSNVLKKIKNQTVGDVKVEVDGADVVFFELGKEKFEDVNFCFRVRFENIHELRLKHPELKEKIVEDSTDYYGLNDKNMVLVKELWHKPTFYLKKGIHIIFVGDVAISIADNDYGEIPCVIDTDIDVHGRLLGRSFITNIEQLQRNYNTIQTSSVRDFSYGSAPKWMVPKGSVKFSSLNNDNSIVEFAGPVPPQLIRNNPISDQAFTLQDRIEQKISKQASVYDISRGNVPPGVTANSALRFLDEQEAQRDSRGTVKRKRRIISVYKMMMKIMAKYYSETDNRTVRIIGKDNQYMIKSLKSADFSRTFDVKIMNSSALPDTKVGKISAIVDLNIATQTDPIFQKEEVIQMLDLGLDDAFKDKATSGVTMAGMVFEMLLNGEIVPAPYEYDDLLVYYNVFIRNMQKPWFKMKVPYEIREDIGAYVKTLEALMWDRANKNPKFAMKLAQVDTYPVFFSLPPMPAMMPTPEQQTNNNVAGQGLAQLQGEDDGSGERAE